MSKIDLAKVTSTLKESQTQNGESSILPRRRGYTIIGDDQEIFHNDIRERPAFYAYKDPRLAKYTSLKEEEAFSLREQYTLAEVDRFYATQMIEDVKSKNTTRRTDEDSDAGKGRKAKAKGVSSDE